MTQVFISYSRRDLAFVEQLAADLQAAGLDVWYDLSGLEGGARWSREIEKAIRDSQYVLVVLSPESVVSKWVEEEFLYASELGKKIVPLFHKKCALPFGYRTLHFVDVQGEKYKRNFDEILRALNVKLIVQKKPVVPWKDLLPKRKVILQNTNLLVALIGLFLLALFGLPSLFSHPENTPVPTVTSKENSALEPIATATVNITITTNHSVTLTKESTPTVTPLPTEITDDFGVEMMLVPAGEFTMGVDANEVLAKLEEKCQGHEDSYYCRPERYEPSSPEHQVYLDAFYVDKYEVTNSLYKDCVDAGICDSPKQTSSNSHQSYYVNPQFDNYPVIFVDWNMANTYCEIWRGGYLPGEAQWEKAARGGLDGKKYPWGDEEPICVAGAENGARFQDLGNNGCIEKDTELVGSYSPNGYGLYDMVGNVAEWVDAWYNAYAGSDFSTQHYGTTHRVARDGGWNRMMGVWGRMDTPPSDYYYSLGFRCARDANP